MKNTAQIQLLNEIGFAKTVLMPGDPLRAKMIAERFLENAILVNNVRGIQGYTGYYKGKMVSVMASGMGIPSMCLYAHELFNFFEVEAIIRIGTAGGLSPSVNLRDVVVGTSVCTDSNVVNQYGIKEPACSHELLANTQDAARELGIELKLGNFYSTDLFYNPNPQANQAKAASGSIAVEMESAGLYTVASSCNKKALAICTVSDLPLLPECPGCSVEERERNFIDMVKIALEVAIKIN